MAFKNLSSVISKIASNSLQTFRATFGFNNACIPSQACQLGKSKKLPFPSRPLELVHNYVWRLAPITLISGFNFFVIFIDDYSQYCWLYPLHHHSRVYDVFVAFKSNVEILLECKIKTFRFDGGEFMSTHF